MQEQGIVVVELNRPKVHNARSSLSLGELKAAFKALEKDDDVLGVVLTGTKTDKGYRPMAGADINELAALTTTFGCQQRALDAQALVTQLMKMRTPVISALDGYVFGAGCEVSMGCHGRVISARSYVGQPEVKIGIIPGSGGCILLPRLVGMERASVLLRTGEPMNAVEAKAYGWAEWVTDEGDDPVDFAVGLLVSHLTDPNPLIGPVSDEAVGKASLPEVDLKWRSQAIDGILCGVLDSTSTLNVYGGMIIEAEAFGRCRETEDFDIGMENFVATRGKQPAAFVHR